MRTPLALILGWAEQLEQDALLPDSSRQKATGIRTQCEKLRTLIDDLNLTSKLEYGAQPLRRKNLRAGPLFRQLVAQFCESPLAERCEITLEQEEPAEQTVLSVDEALLARLLENLLNNSVRHNPEPVNITVHTRRVGEHFCLTVADDGIGYPAAVLVALNAAEPAENAPHILGLYVVQQIAAAHGGTAVFGQNTPCGGKNNGLAARPSVNGAKKENSAKQAAACSCCKQRSYCYTFLLLSSASNCCRIWGLSV